MNKLIQNIFGDAFIGLDCQSGECLHYTQVPGFKASLDLLIIRSILHKVNVNIKLTYGMRPM
jgi:hypothetical protein